MANQKHSIDFDKVVISKYRNPDETFFLEEITQESSINLQAQINKFFNNNKLLSPIYYRETDGGEKIESPDKFMFIGKIESRVIGENNFYIGKVKYGRPEGKGEILHKEDNQTTRVKESDSYIKEYYFGIFIPKHSKQAIFCYQRISNLAPANVFNISFKFALTKEGYTLKPSPWRPAKMLDDWKQNTNINHITYTIDSISEDPTDNITGIFKSEEFELSVILKPKSPKSITSFLNKKDIIISDKDALNTILGNASKTIYNVVSPDGEHKSIEESSDRHFIPTFPFIDKPPSIISKEKFVSSSLFYINKYGNYEIPEECLKS